MKKIGRPIERRIKKPRHSESKIYSVDDDTYDSANLIGDVDLDMYILNENNVVEDNSSTNEMYNNFTDEDINHNYNIDSTENFI